MAGLSFVSLLAASALVLGETVGSSRWIGTLLIVPGMFLVWRKKDLHLAGHPPCSRPRWLPHREDACRRRAVRSSRLRSFGRCPRLLRAFRRDAILGLELRTAGREAEHVICSHVDFGLFAPRGARERSTNPFKSRGPRRIEMARELRRRGSPP